MSVSSIREIAISEVSSEPGPNVLFSTHHWQFYCEALRLLHGPDLKQQRYDRS
jgi:hypothetical protein